MPRFIQASADKVEEKQGTVWQHLKLSETAMYSSTHPNALKITEKETAALEGPISKISQIPWINP